MSTLGEPATGECSEECFWEKLRTWFTCTKAVSSDFKKINNYSLLRLSRFRLFFRRRSLFWG